MGFASLNKEYLTPCNSLNTVVRQEKQILGTVDITWAWPTESQQEWTILEGWIAIAVSLDKAIIRVKIVSQSRNDRRTHDRDFGGFCNGITGTDALRLGEPVTLHLYKLPLVVVGLW